jgi:hypothetical protein
MTCQSTDLSPSYPLLDLDYLPFESIEWAPGNEANDVVVFEGFSKNGRAPSLDQIIASVDWDTSEVKIEILIMQVIFYVSNRRVLIDVDDLNAADYPKNSEAGSTPHEVLQDRLEHLEL